MAIIFLAVVAVLATLTLDRTSVHQQTASQRVNDQAARQIAEAGIEKVLWCLNNPSNTANCPGNPSSYTGESNVTFGRGQYTVSISGTGNSRTLDAYGTVPSVLGDQTEHIRVKLTTTSSQVAFNYGLQAGTGGITMDNNARVVGSVYSNGSVVGDNNADVTGDAVLAVGNAQVNAAANPNPYSTTTFGSSGSSDDYVVQSFVPTTSEKVYEVDVKVARATTGTSSTIDFEIRNNSSGNPGSTVLGSKDNVSASLFPLSTVSGWENGWTEIHLTTANALTAGTTYWIVMKVDSPHSTNNFRVLRSQNDDTVYTGGTAKIGRDTNNLSALCGGGACDFSFQIKMGGTFPILRVAGKSGGAGVGGNAFSNTIESTKVGGHACYQTLIGTVQGGDGSETCSASSTGAAPCTSGNTEATDTPKCHPGNPDPEPAPFPLTTAQIAQMEAQAEAGGVTTCPATTTGCSIANGSSIGPRKYVGNVTFADNAQVTLTGTVWVTGKLSLPNNNRITLANGYAASGGVIIAHDPADEVNRGKIFLDNNVEVFRNSDTGSNILMIAMNNSDNNSDPAFRADNNVNKKDGVNDDLERLIMYAHNGVVYLGNNVSPEAVTGKRIHLSNNVEITYNSGYASAYFSSGPGASWTFQKSSYQIVDD